MSVPVPDSDEHILLAIPLDQVERTTNDVRAALLVGGAAVFAMLLLAGWWALRLGLRPMAEVTEVADAIAAGERDRRASVERGRTEAAHLARAVNTMLDQRIAAENRLRQFVADASHELRTPFAAIRGFTDLYRQGALTDEGAVDEAMRRIGQESRRMGDLVEDLLLLAGFDQGRPLDIAPVDLGAVLADVVLDASATHPSREVALDAVSDLVVDGDDARLRQVFANLLGNALKYGGFHRVRGPAASRRHRRHSPHTSSRPKPRSADRMWATSQTITRWWTVSLRFVTVEATTVPGKDGRPRKWRSDADRVRAHRARQRGEDEPPTVERALVAGDEAAVAWERVRELGVTIEEQRSELKSLKAGLRRSAKSLDQERARFAWIESDNDRLRQELADAKSECDLLRERLERSQSRMPPQPQRPPQRADTVRPNRAQRRAADRRRRGKD